MIHQTPHKKRTYYHSSRISLQYSCRFNIFATVAGDIADLNMAEFSKVTHSTTRKHGLLLTFLPYMAVRTKRAP